MADNRNLEEELRNSRIADEELRETEQYSSYLNLLDTFTRNVKAQMKKKGISYGKLVRKSGVCERSIRRLMNESPMDIGLQMIHKICVALDSDVGTMCDMRKKDDR